MILKLFCQCGQHIEVETDTGGGEIQCPTCGFLQRIQEVIEAPKTTPPVILTNTRAKKLKTGLRFYLLLIVLPTLLLGGFLLHNMKAQAERVRATKAARASRMMTDHSPDVSLAGLRKVFPQMNWARKDFISRRWVKPGQEIDGRRVVCFSKDIELTQAGIKGEASALFEDSLMVQFEFAVESATEFVDLEKIVIKVLGCDGKRSGLDPKSSILWQSHEGENWYSIDLLREENSAGVSRYLSIDLN